MINSIGNFCLTIKFLFGILRDGFLNPYKKVKCDISKKLLILANGPSLKSVLGTIKESAAEYKNCEFSVLNEFVHDELFTVIKPQHYSLNDPMYFMDTIFKEKGLRTMQALRDRVDWPMYLYTSYYWKNSEFLKIALENKNIQVVYFHVEKYNGLDSLRNYFFKKGWGNGEYSTIVMIAIYSALTEGYKKIELYGVDHTFFTGLMVNEDNELCYGAQHFYDNKVEVKPIINHYSGERKPYDIATYLYEKYDIFRGHQIMASYAEHMGAEVLNCTPGSLIDAYPRKKNIHTD